MTTLAKGAVLAAMATVAGLGLAAPSMAAGVGGSTFGCYGIWWNTAWGQKCDAGTPTRDGTYHSHADCSGSSDHDLYVRRAVGNSTYVKAKDDCFFSVHSVATYYQ